MTRSSVMNGPHDLGGQLGFGPVPAECSEQVFSERWEARVLGTAVALGVAGAFEAEGVDEYRARIEELHSVAYMTLSYYQRWLYGLERLLELHCLVTSDEIEDRVRACAEDPDRGLPQPADVDEDGMLASVRHAIAMGQSFSRDVDAPPRFAVGHAVRTRFIALRARGDEHTRLPGYAQGKHGVVEKVYPAMPLPDAVVAGRGEVPEYVYAVRFAARELWADAGARDAVCVDLFESYLEPVVTRDQAPMPERR